METASVFKAMGDPTRQAIIGLLADQDMPLGEIANNFEISRPAIAKHLAIMRRCGLVQVETRGRERIHHLDPSRMKDAQNWLDEMSRFWDQKLLSLKQVVECDDE